MDLLPHGIPKNHCPGPAACDNVRKQIGPAFSFLPEPFLSAQSTVGYLGKQILIIQIPFWVPDKLTRCDLT